MDPSCNGQRVNSYALVTYIPEPLGSYLNALRRDLVAECSIYTHVTILPPRPLAGPEPDALRQIHAESAETPAFIIEPTRIEIFPVTNVIYLGIGGGWDQLKDMHERLNRNALYFDEPYQYHPHITLAQTLRPDQTEHAYEIACRRWAEFSHKRSFPLDHVTFVQNTTDNQWVDLNECPLAHAVSVRR